MASAGGLLLAGVCLALLLAHVMRQRNAVETMQSGLQSLSSPLAPQ